MSETPLFFPNGKYSLFGVLHEPEQTGSGQAFVFAHPFGEEKLWAHRVFVSFARQLAADGHVALRFDNMGSGDSDGDFSESSITSALSDLQCAVDLVRSRAGCRTVSLVGLRLGATVASLAAEQLSGLHRLVLWAPIVDGSRYMQELLRINLTTQMATFRAINQDREAMVAAMQRGETVNVDGYEMAFPFFSEAAAVNLIEKEKGHQGPCLVVQIDRKADTPSVELKALADRYARATVACANEDPFWKEIARFYDQAPSLFTVTHEWLRAHP